MEAVVLAGGRGTRLRPYTVAFPKSLMPIGDYPILEVVIRQLAAAGFTRITLAINHQAELIKAFFGDGSKWNIEIIYSLEDKPLSTMGPLKLIDQLPENFLVMNSDVLTDLDYGTFYKEHVASGACFTISSKTRVQKSEYGVLEVNETNQLTGFKEKPSVEYLVSMGIYMMSQKALAFVPENKAYGFDHLMGDLIPAGEQVQVKPFDGYWLDIGRPDDYEEATDLFEENKSLFLKGE